MTGNVSRTGGQVRVESLKARDGATGIRTGDHAHLTIGTVNAGSIVSRWLLLILVAVLLVASIAALLFYLEEGFEWYSDCTLDASKISRTAYRDHVRSLPDQKRRLLLENAGKALDEEFRRFEATRPRNEFDFSAGVSLIEFLRAVDPGNGHAYYFAGEKRRLLNDWTQPHFLDDFRGYLEMERLYATRVGKPQFVDPVRGYTPMRTAWIHHLTALTWYRFACIATDETARTQALAEASVSMKAAVEAYPEGFNNPDQGIPTAALAALLERQELSRLYCGEAVRVLRPTAAATVGPVPRPEWR